MDKSLELFGLRKDFSEDQLKQAYKDLVQVWHPDKYFLNPQLKEKAEEKLKEINNAYERLQKYFSQRIPDSYQRKEKENHHYKSYFESTSPQSPSQSSTGREDLNSFEMRGMTNTNLFRKFRHLIWIAPIIIILSIAFLGYSHQKNNHTITISKHLEEQYGFEKLRFGISSEKLTTIVKPTDYSEYKNISQKILTLVDTSLNKLGTYPLDTLKCYFFKDRLYRIDMSFSENQDDIFNALKAKYGVPYDDDNWTRGKRKLVGKSWEGINVRATILAPFKVSEKGAHWDLFVVQEINTVHEAYTFAKDGPKRAAADLRFDN